MKMKVFEFETDYHCDSFVEYCESAPVDFEVTDDLQITVYGSSYTLRRLQNIYNRIINDED